MKADLKIVCIILLALCLVAKNEAWWKRRSSSRSRGGSRSPSSSSSSRSSSSSSSSSSTRRGWFIRRPRVRKPPTVRPTAASSKRKHPTRCSIRMGCLPSFARRRPAPTKRPAKSWTRCSLRFGWCKPLFRTTKATQTTKPTPTTPPSLSQKLKQPGKDNKQGSVSTTCIGLPWLLKDIDGCKDKWRIPLHKPENLTDVLLKKVIGLQKVERPMGYCGYKVRVQRPYDLSPSVNVPKMFYDVSAMYGEGTIRCLHRRLGIKTSISGKKDRVMHSGVVVETEDHKKYLIHKGKFDDAGGNRIIEESSKEMYAKGYKTVGNSFKPVKLRSIKEYYDVIGSKYNFWNDNCHDGTLRMVALAEKN